MKLIFKIVLFATFMLILLTVSAVEVEAQCAMCRATLENNVSNGEIGIAAGLNFGILYLFAMPYLVVGFIAFMWYRRSKLNAETQGYPTR